MNNITLRNYFVGQALTGVLSGKLNSFNGITEANPIKLSFKIADQVMAQLDKPHSKKCLEAYTKRWSGVQYNPPFTPDIGSGCICQ